jgi:hypothetical protein
MLCGMADEEPPPSEPEELEQEQRRSLFPGLAMPGLNFGALGGALFPRLRRGREPVLPEDEPKE